MKHYAKTLGRLLVLPYLRKMVKSFCDGYIGIKVDNYIIKRCYWCGAVRLNSSKCPICHLTESNYKVYNLSKMLLEEG